MRYYLLLRILFILAAVNSYGELHSQNPRLDSLVRLINVAKDDTFKIQLLKKAVFIWVDTDVDSAKNYINMLRTLSDKLSYPEGIIYADVKLAEIYNFSGDFMNATNLNRKNLDYSLKNGTDYQRADVLKTFAMTYAMQEINDSALHYWFEATRIYEKRGDSLSMAKVMTNMAIVHENMGDLDKAIAYCERSKNIFKGKEENAYLVTLTNLALYQGYKKEYEKAEANYREALQIATRVNNINSLAHIYSGLTDVAYWQKKYPEMLPYAREFSKIAGIIRNDDIKLRADLAMAKSLFFTKKYKDAEPYFNSVMHMANAVQDERQLKDIYGLYSYFLLAKDGNVEAFDFYRQKIDSLSALENKQIVTKASKELEAKYETEKKDNQIKLQAANIRQQQLWNYLLIGAIVALGLIGLISYGSFRNRQKLLEQDKILQQQKITQLEQEKQLTATQAILQGQDEERSRLAKDLHDGLGGMLSGIKFSFNNMKENLSMTQDNQQAFARNMDMLDGIIHEMRRVAHNMMPESLIKFGLDASLQDMCNYVQESTGIKVDYQSLGLKGLTIEKNIATHIYRIIQELLNNTMKHAKATEAVVQVAYDNQHFSITVEDNGKGFDTIATGGIPSRSGMGWQNIQNRIISLKGTMDVQSSANKGTSVLVEFNFNES